MLVSYRVYRPNINNFVNEIRELKQSRYDFKLASYVVEFTDNVTLYIPKEHDLDEQLFVRNKTDNTKDDYYIIVDDKVALLKIEDATEAQLRLNELASIEHSSKFGNRWAHAVIFDECYFNTTIGEDADGIQSVQGFDGKDIVTCTVDDKMSAGEYKELLRQNKEHK